MTNVLIVGVGGQGTLLASRVLGSLAVDAGYDVKVSEVHGMAQRGGSVVTYVRYGRQVYSPLVELGEADAVLAFEKLEALRYLAYLKPGGRMIVNDQEILPMPVITGTKDYPADAVERLRNAGVHLTVLDARAIAGECGDERALNTVLLGVYAGFGDFSEQAWRQAIEKTVPAKALSVNQSAFTRGWNFTRG